MAEWDKKTTELRKKKLLWKQQACDRREEIGSDDDDDNEVATDVDWDVLEDEDMLTDAHRPMQGPFPFHAEGSESVRSAEVGQTSSPSTRPTGAKESAASCGVLAEDRWVGGGEPAAAPEVLMEGGGSATVPHGMMEAGGAVAPPEALTERGGSVAAPSEIRETNSPAREQGASSKRARPDESRGLGVHPQNAPTAQRR